MSASTDAMRIESPQTQPSNERPVPGARGILSILIIAAAVLYAWGLASDPINGYYAAIVRSMSANWHNFVYGAFDPRGFISADKLPGAYWIQSLSVRIFGFHVWALVLPGVLATIASVPLLYSLVRRWAGEYAGLLAALLFTVSPITAAVARVNLPDNFLVLFLLLATHQFWKALERGRLRDLVISAVWLGAAFNVKMIVALILLPALLGVYVLCAEGTVVRRLARSGVYLLVTAVVSLPWLVIVSLTPAADRPYLDGSTHNSVWQMIFIYNGFGRVDNANGVTSAGSSSSALLAPHFAGNTGITRLAGSTLGGQISWLIPLALLALVVGLYGVRTAGRTDPTRAGWLFWGLWLACYGVAFSWAPGAHPYYTVALVPAVAALAGAGLVLFTRAWLACGRLAWALPVAAAITGGWAFVVLSRTPHYMPWLRVLVLVGTVLSTVLLLARRGSGPRVLGPVVTVPLAVALLLAPASWAITPLVRDSSINPVAGPTPDYSAFFASLKGVPGMPPGGISPAMASQFNAQLNGDGGVADPRVVSYLESHQGGARYAVAMAGSENAAPYVELGLPVLPIGGFSSETPIPTMAQLAALVRSGQLRYMLLASFSPTGGSPQATAWARAHCRPVNLAGSGGAAAAGGYGTTGSGGAGSYGGASGSGGAGSQSGSGAASFFAAMTPVLYDCAS
jgi:4-amino-4-deoxy-L-arabinose transferase-like glycosyltransferase